MKLNLDNNTISEDKIDKAVRVYSVFIKEIYSVFIKEKAVFIKEKVIPALEKKKLTVEEKAIVLQRLAGSVAEKSL